MPYIKQNEKNLYEYYLKNISQFITNPGELTYCIYRLMLLMTKKNNKSFANMSSIIGSIECAKMEYYRRIVSPYEDKKIKENGDVDET